jgi:rRNA maturation RNase YbeY
VNKLDTLEIYNETKWPHTTWPFLAIKDEILGKKYSLSLSILKPANSKKVNIKQRGKDYIPNTLSFQYLKNSGEIILTPDIIKKECNEYQHSENEHALFLFIHSCLHLKGHLHGDKMESLEEKYFKKFNK